MPIDAWSGFPFCGVGGQEIRTLLIPVVVLQSLAMPTVEQHFTGRAPDVRATYARIELAE